MNTHAVATAESGQALPILVGYRATGKSTLAADLARQLDCRWLDADDAFEAAFRSSIARFITDRGEPAFRDAETALLGDLLEQPDAVLSTGGGVVLRPENRRLLKRSGRPVVWLTAPAAAIRRRLAADPSTSGRRPALAGGDVLGEVEQALAHRERFYREVANGIFDTAAVQRDALVTAVCRWLAEWRPLSAGGEAEQ